MKRMKETRVRGIKSLCVIGIGIVYGVNTGLVMIITLLELWGFRDNQDTEGPK